MCADDLLTHFGGSACIENAEKVTPDVQVLLEQIKKPSFLKEVLFFKTTLFGKYDPPSFTKQASLTIKVQIPFLKSETKELCLFRGLAPSQPSKSPFSKPFSSRVYHWSL